VIAVPTIKEIAARANVSIATVSKVLNGMGGASEQTIAKIQELAREMNYTPNILAKSLKIRQSRTIGIITEDLTVFNTPEIVDGIDYCCEKNGYHYILGNLRLNKRFGHDFFETDLHHQIIDTTISTMLSKQVEGIIYVGCHNHEIHYLPENLKIPLVCAYCYSSNPNNPSVIYDDKKAGYDATELLIKNGHRAIGIICGLPDSEHTQNRLRGYQEALYENSILFNPRMLVYGNWERESGYRASRQLVENGVTAIFAHNDEMALGVVDYCNEANLTVGKDLSLIGFDNKEIGTVCRPKLSTVSLPLFEIGEKATEIILNLISGTDSMPEEHLKMECHLLNRESVSAIEPKE
jgi:LacI family transcriptional regulator